ncbi:MAG: LlaJI family restriction endonuclease [Eggerthellaceae bacterium]|jgi:hypothetical protein
MRPYALVRELKPYSLAEIAQEMGCGEGLAGEVVDRLLSRGVVRFRTGTESDEGEVADEAGASDDERYQFRYVGIVVACGVVIICYPKYIRRKDGPTDDELKQMLRVLRRLDGYGELPRPRHGGASADRLAVIVRLLELYEERGVYTNFEETRVLNGNGVIDWGRTVDTINPILSEGQPVYLDLWTRKTRRDETDVVTRLHRAILTECSRFLTRCGVAELLGIGEVELSAETVDDFGDAEALDWMLERERASQFVTWKQEAIDLMRLYLGGAGTSAVADEVLCMGTTAYYHAWELACKKAFGDLLDTRLGDLPIGLAEGWRERANEKLLQIIPRPLWARPDGTGLGDVDTLIPDTVTIATNGDGSWLLCIYDAKYYVPELGGKITRQPGVESVTKQFLYQSAYRQFVVDHGFDRVVNAFLVPSEGDEPTFLASVSFNEVMGPLVNEIPQFSDHIDMWSLPAGEIFECYLQGRALPELPFTFRRAPC